MEGFQCEKCGFFFTEPRAIHDCIPVNVHGQTKVGSALESVFNIVVGFTVSFIANLIVLPWFGMKCNARAAFGIGLIFTVISFVRSYALRRVFNWIMIRWRL